MAPFGGDHNVASRTQVFSLQHCIAMSRAVMWTYGEVTHSFCTDVTQLSEPKKCFQDCLWSTTQLLHGRWLQ